MPTNETVLRVFVAAPGDIGEERDIVGKVVNDWNVHRGRSINTRLEMVWWRNSARPQIGGRPQALINRQVLDDADIVVGIFWSRFGTPTGVANSGTEEELCRSIEAGKPVMLYFCKRDIPQAALDTEQFGKIQAFKRDMSPRGLFWEYSTNEEFAEQFSRHLAETVNDVLPGNDEMAKPHTPADRKTQLEEVKVPGMGSTFAVPVEDLDIPLPTVRGQITDRDRIRFIRDAFGVIHDYFRQGLKQLESANDPIQTDFDEINSVQFACRIYLNGDQVAQCKIWRSDSMGSPSIHYSTNDVTSTTGNSFNEWLTICIDDTLSLNAHFSPFGNYQGDTEHMDPPAAARYLWKRLTEYLSG